MRGFSGNWRRMAFHSGGVACRFVQLASHAVSSDDSLYVCMQTVCLILRLRSPLQGPLLECSQKPFLSEPYVKFQSDQVIKLYVPIFGYIDALPNGRLCPPFRRTILAKNTNDNDTADDLSEGPPGHYLVPDSCTQKWVHKVGKKVDFSTNSKCTFCCSKRSPSDAA